MRTSARRLLRDLVSVRRYAGESSTGPVFDQPVDVAGKVTLTQQLTRTSDGVEVLSQMTVYVDPADAELFPPESAVTVEGRTGTVLSVSAHSRPGQAVIAKVMCS